MDTRKCLLLVVLVAQCLQIRAQAPGQMQNIQITSEGRSRSFYLRVPSTWRPDSEPMPVVLNWHGLTSTPLQQALYSGTNPYGEEYGWAIAYPAGIGNSFNAGACCGTAASSRVNDVQFARDIITAIESRGVRVRRDAIFSMGMSNGGFMSYRMACEGADLVSAIGPNAGRRAFGSDFNSCNPVRPVPIISITGTADLLVPYNGNGQFPSFAADLTNMRTAMGCNMTEPPFEEVITPTSTCQVFSQCNQNVFLEYCTVQRGSHTWFRGPNNIDSTGYFFMRFAQITPGLVPKPFLNLEPEVELQMPKYLE